MLVSGQGRDRAIGMSDSEESRPTHYRSDRGTSGRRIVMNCTLCGTNQFTKLEEDTGQLTVKCTKCGKVVGKVE